MVIAIYLAIILSSVTQSATTKLFNRRSANSTLFNAVARADLEIVSRSPHAWPSTYVNIGEDATVGSIEIGKRANLCLLDKDFQLKQLFVDGKAVIEERMK